MPQNPLSITESQEFKDFVKNANLEVFNLESFQIALFTANYAAKDLMDRIQQLEERLLEAGNNIPISHNSDIINR